MRWGVLAFVLSGCSTIYSFDEFTFAARRDGASDLGNEEPTSFDAVAPPDVGSEVATMDASADTAAMREAGADATVDLVADVRPRDAPPDGAIVCDGFFCPFCPAGSLCYRQGKCQFDVGRDGGCYRQ